MGEAKQRGTRAERIQQSITRDLAKYRGIKESIEAQRYISVYDEIVLARVNWYIKALEKRL